MIRSVLGALALGAAFTASATAQTSVTLTADPVPIIEAQINGRPVRLEVDPRMPAWLVLNGAAAQRLGVRVLPFGHVAFSLVGGGASVRGRIARPRLVFSGAAGRAMTGVFGVPLSARADGVIGPGALPYDVVTIILKAEASPGARDLALPLSGENTWVTSTRLGGETAMIQFNLAAPDTIFNRTAAQRFDAAGLIHSDGALAEAHVILGLSTLMQPVRTDLRPLGFAVAPALARTNSPLLGADNPDDIVVEASDKPAPPAVTIGRAALAQCDRITVNRSARQLVLHCAPS